MFFVYFNPQNHQNFSGSTLAIEKFIFGKRVSPELVKDKKRHKKMILLKKIFNVLIYAFALSGFILITGFFAIRLGLTNVSGEIDSKNSHFSANAQKLKVASSIATPQPQIPGDLTVSTIEQEIKRLQEIRTVRANNYCKIQAVGEYFPINSRRIIEIAQDSKSDQVVAKTLTALELGLDENSPLKNQLSNCANNNSLVLGADFPSLEQKFNAAESNNAFYWVNTPEWQAIKEATVKDKPIIDQVSQLTGVESRLIVSGMIVEQLRLFNSEREVFKKFFEPLKILCSANKISLGVMGIKEQTAITIENHLKDPTCNYYLGKDFENILDFGTSNVSQERYDRLASEKDHYYSYLYGALYLKQFMNQWKKAGYDIQYRPEIVGTLFNVGFPQSKPNPDPKVGGSHIKVGEKEYSFGSLAYEFYYSGELVKEFPYKTN